nr:uncharacterized protein LOC125424186 [Ziziphus jujuba var. spinosa]
MVNDFDIIDGLDVNFTDDPNFTEGIEDIDMTSSNNDSNSDFKYNDDDSEVEKELLDLAIKTRAYLQAYDLWELFEVDYEVEPLRASATVNQNKLHSEENAKPFKTLTVIQAAMTDDIFTKIMTCTTPRQAWEKVQEEFQGNQRIIEKILICLPEKYEANISTLEETRDLTQITVAELINALQATEQRRSLRLQGESSSSEAALVANNKGKTIQQPRPFQRQNRGKETTNQRGNTMTYGPCIICKKQGHTAKICWWRPNTQCKICKQFDHMERVCKQRNQRQEARQAYEPEELNREHEHTFTATCNLTATTKDKWILDSGCPNHMCNNCDLFVKLNSRIATKIRAANGHIMEAQEKEIWSLKH